MSKQAAALITPTRTAISLPLALNEFVSVLTRIGPSVSGRPRFAPENVFPSADGLKVLGVDA